MYRSRKILITCHCAINANAKVPPLATVGGVFTDSVSEYIQSGCGLLQLPCPEVWLFRQTRTHLQHVEFYI
jgi:predicted secreted protein